MVESKILKINLSTGGVSAENTKPENMELYIGGQGVAAAMFVRDVPPGTDAFDEANEVIFSVGPFCGTVVPLCGRHFVLSKSPLTGLIGEASSGGFFGKELKCSGFDHVVITGKSASPVYLSIRDGAASIKDASGIWGKGTRATEAMIKEDLADTTVKVASIGPAGENLVRFAAIMNEHDRAAGRCGLGAVMGSKKLKAIAVKGTGKAPVEDEAALKEAAQKLRELVKESPQAKAFSSFGTPSGIDTMESYGDIPVNNYRESRWKGLKGLGAEALAKRGEIKKHACYNCPVACTGLVKYGEEFVRWPEYETLSMLGSNLLVGDLEAVIRWNVLVDDLGMDTISLGAVLGSVLEAIEKGILKVDLDSFGFAKEVVPEKGDVYKIFGSVGPIEKLIGMIARREGIGNDLAEGTRRFVDALHWPSELATHGKGLEVPAHEPRACDMSALDYATTPRGAYHCYTPVHLIVNMNLKKDIGVDKAVDRFSANTADGRNGLDVSAEMVVKIQDAGEAYSACGGCIFGFEFTPEVMPWVAALNAITGTSRSLDDWMRVGRRLIDLKRAYSIECGITKADDTLGPRFFQAIPKGGTKQHVPPLGDLLPRYYTLRGWDAEGRPPRAT
ncbi:MAG: aldehyde ferredoxin oxidoreductase family protein [Candidatus Lokiarchaeota archaeon]|nr:aldehyde ferredoxin oxidoreductase family protein [Candidatus Lokiarchaeota archaeon]